MDRVYYHKQEIDKLFKAGAKFYTCGSSRTLAGIKDVCVRLMMENEGWDRPTAEAAWGRLQHERHAADVFG